jgi:hypothetical protein
LEISHPGEENGDVDWEKPYHEDEEGVSVIEE